MKAGAVVATVLAAAGIVFGITATTQTSELSAAAPPPLNVPGLNVQPVWSSGGTWPASAYQQIAAKGFGNVRFVLFWKDLEPTKGTYDETRLGKLDQAIKDAGDAGLGVTLTPIFLTGSGGMNFVPDWAKAGGGDSVAIINRDGAGIETTLAKRYADNPTVTAIDLVSEPYTNGSTNSVLSMYANLIGAVRAVAPGKLLFFEPKYGDWGMTASGGDVELITDANGGNPGPVALSVHDYFTGGPGCGNGFTSTGSLVNRSTCYAYAGSSYDPANWPQLEAHLQAQLDWLYHANIPMNIGEFGINAGKPGHDQLLIDQVSRFNKFGCDVPLPDGAPSLNGWAAWEFHSSDPTWTATAANDWRTWQPWADSLLGRVCVTPPPPPPPPPPPSEIPLQPGNVGPINATAPEISGTPTEGQTLTVAPGAWTGVPSTFVTHIYRCAQPANSICEEVSSGPPDYRLVAADVGERMIAYVKATNAVGEGWAGSLETAKVAALAVPPTATAVATPGGGDAPLTVAFTGSGTATAPATITTYAWDFGDSTGTDVASPTHTYTSAGTYRATLTVTDSNGATGRATTDIAVTAPPPPSNEAPIARITAEPTTGVAPLPVDFDGTGSTDVNGTVDAYAWAFGDGTTATGATVSHTYAAGNWTATLTVTDNGGATATARTTVTATTPPPPTTTTPTTTTPTTPTTPTSTTPTTPPGGTVVMAVGDVTSSASNGNATAVKNAIAAANPAKVLMLGDYQYTYGSISAILGGADKIWGPKPGGLYALTAPTAGPTHDVTSCTSSDYQSYWGRPSMLAYSFDVGGWHLISLPSAAYRYGCDTAGVLAWLKADLAANPSACTLAFWHEPYWTRPTSTHPSGTSAVKPWIDALTAAKAEIVLNGHQHDYQRFAEQGGIREFIVGTGGIGFYGFTGTAANVDASNADTYGALKLTLKDGSYDWSFVRAAGGSFTDSGSGTCH